MTATVRRAGTGDIPALLPLIEQYWAFEDIAGFDPARVGTELNHLFADQRLGAGSHLLQAAEAAFARIKCTNVSLQLGRGNDAAREFYRRHGYPDRPGFELLDKMRELR